MMTQPDPPILDLRAVALNLRGQPLIGPLDIALGPGGAAAVMGPSGCGKSSLLNAICGTLDPAFSISGDILVAGKSLLGMPPEERRVGILFQDDLLFPHLSVGENLAFGLPAGLSRSERSDRVAQALDEAGMTGFEARDPATLSGGQRARVACLRAMISEPSVLLLDEPFSKLDAALRDRFRRFVIDHARMRDLPILLVTHDRADASALEGEIYEISLTQASNSE